MAWTTYRQHMVTVSADERSNYRITCTCGHVGYVASLSDVFAAEEALRHVEDAQEIKEEGS